MSEQERKYFKQIDDEILNASGEKLKNLQNLDIATQLSGTTFYDICAIKDQKILKNQSVDSM